jgi:hypothetical protein
MRKPTLGLLTFALLALPTAASAGGLHLELSVGSGVRTTPSPQERIPTNVGATLGLGLTDMLKLQVGAIANLGDVQESVSDVGASDFDVDLRGMLVIAPPLFPLYLRGIVGVTDLVQGGNNVTYGGALGLGFGLLGIGGFIEAGAMQRTYTVTLPEGGEGSKDGWQVEGRLGVSIG